MNLLTRIRKSALCRIPVSLLTMILIVLPPGIIPAQAPDWWSARGVLKTDGSLPDDYAALNQGQLKNLVRAAVLEMDEYLDGGAGIPLHGLLYKWAHPTVTPDDFATVNLGQLKAVAAPVYDRLIAVGMASGYPWNNANGIPTDDYAVANIGQAKNVFAFNARDFDSDYDGIPDWWERKYGLNPADPNDAQTLAANGLPYSVNYKYGLNPNDPNSSDTPHTINGQTDGLTWLEAFQQDFIDALKPPVGATEIAIGSTESAIWSQFIETTIVVQSNSFEGEGTDTYTPTDPITGEPQPTILHVLTLAQVLEYWEKKGIPDSPPIPLVAGAVWKDPWEDGVSELKDPEGNPVLHGKWKGIRHEAAEIGEAVMHPVGAVLSNERIEEVPTGAVFVSPLADKYNGSATYVFTDIPGGPPPIPFAIEIARAQYPGILAEWMAIAPLGAAARAHPGYHPDNRSLTATATADGAFGVASSRQILAVWLRTEDRKSAAHPITRTYLKVTTSLTDSSTISTVPVQLTIQKGEKTSEAESLVPAPGTSVTLSLLPVELYTDLNNDGKVNAEDGLLTNLPYRYGATEPEKDKGTEFMFANDNLSNGAWDKDDSVTPGKPATAIADDDAEEIHINPGITEGEVWLTHPGIAGLKFYEDSGCTHEIHLSPSQHRTVVPAIPFPARVFARAESVTFPSETTQSVPRPNPQPPVTVKVGARHVDGDLTLWIKPPGGPAAGIAAAKMKLTIVQGVGSDKFYRAAIDYIYEQNTSYCTRYIEAGATKSRCTVMLASQSGIVGINAKPRGGGIYMYNIDDVIARAPNKQLTVVMNCTYAADDSGHDEFFFKLFRGTLWTGLQTYDDSCSIVSPFDAGNGPGKPDIRGYVTDETVPPLGRIKFGIGEVPNRLDPNPQALHGSGGLPKGGASDAGIHGRVDGWTCLAEIKIDNERLLVTAVEDPDSIYTPIQFAMDLARPHNVESNIYWPDPGGSFCYALITPGAPGNPIGTLKTIAKGERHIWKGKAARECIKPYIGFVSLPPRLP